MRHFTTLLASVTAVLAATPAHAGGDPYVGAHVGVGWTEAQTSTSTVYSTTGYFAQTSVPAIAASGVQQIKPRGIDVGLDAGYDWHLPGFMVGVAGDVSIFNGYKTVSTTTPYPCCAPTTFTINQSVKTNWLATARVRAGVDFSGTSIYVTGGWAGLQARYSALFTDTFATAHEFGFQFRIPLRLGRRRWARHQVRQPVAAA